MFLVASICVLYIHYFRVKLLVLVVLKQWHDIFCFFIADITSVVSLSSLEYFHRWNRNLLMLWVRAIFIYVSTFGTQYGCRSEIPITACVSVINNSVDSSKGGGAVMEAVHQCSTQGLQFSPGEHLPGSSTTNKSPMSIHVKIYGTVYSHSIQMLT